VSWPSVRLGELVAIKTGRLDANAADDNGLYPFFTCSRETLRINAHAFDCDAVLIAGNGDLNVKHYKGKFNAYQRTYVVTSLSGEILDSRYLYYFMSKYVDRLRELSIGGVIKYIKIGMLTDVEIPLPPPEEQKRIATILDKADAIRRKRQQAIQLADEFLRTVFLDMFGDPVTNPKGWKIEKIDDLCEVHGGLQVSKKRSELSISAPYLRVANVLRNSLHLDEIKEINLTQDEYDRVRLKRDDVLIVEGHGNPNEIGRSALWTGEIDGMVHQNHLIRVRVKSKEICPRFVNDYINSPGGRVQMMKASNTTSGLNTISTGIVKSTEIIVPPVCLQDKYMSVVSKFGDVLVKKRMYENGIDLSFFSLSKKAFQGNL